MEADVRFEPSGRHGVVVIGTYLMDAALRFGIRIEDDCGRLGQCDSCAVKITKGAQLLSQPTRSETEHLTPERRKNGERLSCQAKIEKPGEICVMTTEKPKPEATIFEQYQKEFSKLPLNEKIKNLLDLETETLGETFTYLLNLPYTIGEKVRDGIAEFGFKIEEEEKKAKRPAEHKAKTEGETPSEKETSKRTPGTPRSRAAKPKSTGAKKPAARKRTPKTGETPGT